MKENLLPKNWKLTQNGQVKNGKEGYKWPKMTHKNLNDTTIIQEIKAIFYKSRHSENLQETDDSNHSMQILPEDGRSTLQLILWDLDTQTTQGYYKKRKLQANFNYEYRCKTSKNN